MIEVEFLNFPHDFYFCTIEKVRYRCNTAMGKEEYFKMLYQFIIPKGLCIQRIFGATPHNFHLLLVVCSVINIHV